MSTKCFYGVYNGRQTGVFDSWDTARVHVTGFKGAVHKKFVSRAAAMEFVTNGPKTTDIKQTKLSKFFEVTRKTGLEHFGIVVRKEVKVAEESKMFTDSPYKPVTAIEPWADFSIEDKLVIFTDGSCVTDKKGSKGGIGIHFPQKFMKDIGSLLTRGKPTNQRAELYAIHRAIEVVTSSSVYNRQCLCIYSDSEYSIKCLTTWIKKWLKNNWKTAKGSDVTNADLIKPLYGLYLKHRVKLVHVRAHTGGTDRFSLANHAADRLAYASTH